MVSLNTIVQLLSRRASGLMGNVHWIGLRQKVSMSDSKTAIVAGAQQGISAGFVEGSQPTIAAIALVDQSVASVNASVSLKLL